MSDVIDWECTTEDGVLSIDSVVMHRPAWAVFDVALLWEGPDQRGTDTQIPGRPGVLPNMRRADLTARTLRMTIDGRFDIDGNDVADPAAGLLANITWLREHVTDPTYTGTGTRTVVLTGIDGGGSFTGEAHVSMKLGARVGPLWRAALVLSLPDGALER